MNTSIVIPVYNRLDLLKPCLESLYDTENNSEIIVVDNASSDGSQEYLKIQAQNGLITLIINPENVGFAHACNQGASKAKSDSVLFLNSDIIARPGWLGPLQLILENDRRVAVVGAKLLYPNTTIQHAGVSLFSNSLTDFPTPFHTFCGGLSNFEPANQRMFCPAVTGACLLIRRGIFLEVGGFDESYWNGNEDVDLCFKVNQIGKKVVYEPGAVLIHYESQSGPERFRKVQDNVLLLANKWMDKVKADFILDSKTKTYNYTGMGYYQRYE